MQLGKECEYGTVCNELRRENQQSFNGYGLLKMNEVQGKFRVVKKAVGGSDCQMKNEKRSLYIDSLGGGWDYRGVE